MPQGGPARSARKRRCQKQRASMVEVDVDVLNEGRRLASEDGVPGEVQVRHQSGPMTANVACMDPWHSRTRHVALTRCLTPPYHLSWLCLCPQEPPEKLFAKLLELAADAVGPMTEEELVAMSLHVGHLIEHAMQRERQLVHCKAESLAKDRQVRKRGISLPHPLLPPCSACRG